MNEEIYSGPSPLREALDAAEPCPQTGARVAVSTPEGYLIAIEWPGMNVIIRRVNDFGTKGSKKGTGEWRDAEAVEAFLKGRGTWRSA